MSGNYFGRTYAGGTSAPLHHQKNSQNGNGYILTGRVGGKNNIGPIGSRCYSTASQNEKHKPETRTTTSTMPTTKGYAPHPHNSYQANPGGFINGIRNIVNRFINPKLNCDFHSDHNRRYNPKYRNNFMMDRRSEPLKTVVASAAQCKPCLPSVFIDLGATNATRTSVQKNTSKEPSAAAQFEITIFTSDDFPALPAIKKYPPKPPPILPAASTTMAKSKSPPKRCQLNKPRSIPSIAKQASSPLDKDFTCDFVVLTKAMPKTCNTATESGSCSPITKGMPTFRSRPRIRKISECSDDSFVICFSDDAPEGVLELANDSDDYSDSDSDFDLDSEDEDDDIDETDTCVRNLLETTQLDSGFDDRKDKKVRFNLNPDIHIMYKWDFAYRAARKGHWENFARDRHRFKNRIEVLSNVISPILDTQHREKIYRTRFCDSDNNAASDNKDQQSTTIENSN